MKSENLEPRALVEIRKSAVRIAESAAFANDHAKKANLRVVMFQYAKILEEVAEVLRWVGKDGDQADTLADALLAHSKDPSVQV